MFVLVHVVQGEVYVEIAQYHHLLTWLVADELVQLSDQSLVDAPLLLGLPVYADDLQHFVPFLVRDVVDVDVLGGLLHVLGDDHLLPAEQELAR